MQEGEKKRLELDWQLQLVVQCCNPLSLYFLLCSTQRCKRQRGHLHSMENKAHVKFAIFAMEFPPWFGPGLASRGLRKVVWFKVEHGSINAPFFYWILMQPAEGFLTRLVGCLLCSFAGVWFRTESFFYLRFSQLFFYLFISFLAFV